MSSAFWQLSSKTSTHINEWKLDDGKFLKVGELCDLNIIFNLLLKKSATTKHNVLLNFPHIKA